MSARVLLRRYSRVARVYVSKYLGASQQGFVQAMKGRTGGKKSSKTEDLYLCVHCLTKPSSCTTLRFNHVHGAVAIKSSHAQTAHKLSYLRLSKLASTFLRCSSDASNTPFISFSDSPNVLSSLRPVRTTAARHKISQAGCPLHTFPEQAAQSQLSGR